jgi:predicted nucleic acid-binding protein
MAVFVDTSALYSALTVRDEHHRAARDRWTELLTGDEPLISTNYVLVETLALLARRVGFQAIRDFQADFVPVLQVSWVDQALHERAMAALLTAGMRDLSLVDCVSFAVMRGLGLDTAFAFDAHFVQQGFGCIP